MPEILFQSGYFKLDAICPNSQLFCQQWWLQELMLLVSRSLLIITKQKYWQLKLTLLEPDPPNSVGKAQKGFCLGSYVTLYQVGQLPMRRSSCLFSPCSLLGLPAVVWREAGWNTQQAGATRSKSGCQSQSSAESSEALHTSTLRIQNYSEVPQESWG